MGFCGMYTINRLILFSPVWYYCAELKEFSLAGRLREIFQIAKLLVHIRSAQSGSVGANGCGKVELIQSN